MAKRAKGLYAHEYNDYHGNSTGKKAERLVTSCLHPQVYAMLIGLSLWFVV